MEGPRSTTSSAPPASFQYQNLTVDVSDVKQTRDDLNIPRSFTPSTRSSLDRIWVLGMALPDS